MQDAMTEDRTLCGSIAGFLARSADYLELPLRALAGGEGQRHPLPGCASVDAAERDRAGA